MNKMFLFLSCFVIALISACGSVPPIENPREETKFQLMSEDDLNEKLRHITAVDQIDAELMKHIDKWKADGYTLVKTLLSIPLDTGSDHPANVLFLVENQKVDDMVSHAEVVRL